MADEDWDTNLSDSADDDEDSDNVANTTRSERVHSRIFGEILDEARSYTRDSQNEMPRLIENAESHTRARRSFVVSSNDGIVSERVIRWANSIPDDACIDSSSPIQLSGLQRCTYRSEKNAQQLPPIIRYGNRSYQPTAKFLDTPKAYPAKPGIDGFSPCHEKAMAAFSVYNSIQHDSEDEDAPANADVFSHFWIETNVQRPSNDNNGSTPQDSSSNSESMDALEDNRTETPPLYESHSSVTYENYEQWDRETSLINNPLNYDLWNEFPESSGTPSHPQVNGHGSLSSTIGVGTNDLNLQTVEQQTDMVGSENNIQVESSSNMEGASEIHHLIRQRLRRNDRDMEHDFGNCDDEISRMFALDFPVPPGVMDQRMPRSFLEEAYCRGENTVIFSLSSDSSESESNENENDDDYAGGSVFPLVPEADNTPSSLLTSLKHELDNPSSADFVAAQIEDILSLLENDVGNYPNSGPPPRIDFTELESMALVSNDSPNEERPTSSNNFGQPDDDKTSVCMSQGDANIFKAETLMSSNAEVLKNIGPNDVYQGKVYFPTQISISKAWKTPIELTD